MIIESQIIIDIKQVDVIDGVNKNDLEADVTYQFKNISNENAINILESIIKNLKQQYSN
jgi:hypothetical protein